MSKRTRHESWFYPTSLRAADKTTLSWDQLRLVLPSAPLRDRILLTLDMTETFRPCELFALRWSGFDMDAHSLTVTQTAYEGKLREFGKTRKSLRTVQGILGHGKADTTVNV